MMTVAKKSLVPNDEEFDCPICFMPIEVGQGVKLRECLHNCCKFVLYTSCIYLLRLGVNTYLLLYKYTVSSG